MNLLTLLDRFPDETACRQHLEALRWPSGVRCPRCGSEKIARVKTRNQFTCKSKACRYRFSVTTNTIMHASKLPLRKWFIAVYLLSDAKKSISSLQLSRELGISAECCWHMTMRIRQAMRDEFGEPFRGIVQVDDYFHGGNPRPGAQKQRFAKRGRGTEKQPIIGAIENSTGRFRTAMITNVSGQQVVDTISNWLRASGVELHSDQWVGYRKIGRMCKLHRTVNHHKEYVAADGTHCNGVENAWSLFTRSVVGSFHKISVKHLPRYLDEFGSRYNARRENGTYFPRVLNQCFGRTLPMKTLVSHPMGA